MRPDLRHDWILRSIVLKFATFGIMAVEAAMNLYGCPPNELMNFVKALRAPAEETMIEIEMIYGFISQILCCAAWYCVELLLCLC